MSIISGEILTKSYGERRIMKQALLIASLIIIYTLQSFLGKKYSDNYEGNPASSSYVFTVVTGFFVSLVAWAATGFSAKIEPMTFLLGIINAAAAVLYDVFLIRASRSGPYSVLMVCILSGGILIPAVAAMFFGEIPSAGRWIAIAIVLVSIALVSHKSDGEKVTSKTFYLYCAGIFLANGIYGSLYDIQRRLTGAAEKEKMTMVTFLFSTVFAAVYLLITRRKLFFYDFKQTRKSGLYIGLSSLVKASAILLLVYSLSVVNVTVLYTFENAGVLVLSVIASCVFFKEKLSLVNAVGCFLTCVGLVMMTLPALQ